MEVFFRTGSNWKWGFSTPDLPKCCQTHGMLYNSSVYKIYVHKEAIIHSQGRLHHMNVGTHAPLEKYGGISFSPAWEKLA